MWKRQLGPTVLLWLTICRNTEPELLSDPRAPSIPLSSVNSAFGSNTMVAAWKNGDVFCFVICLFVNFYLFLCFLPLTLSWCSVFLKLFCLPSPLIFKSTMSRAYSISWCILSIMIYDSWMNNQPVISETNLLFR